MEQITIQEYQGIKQHIKEKLNETVNNFIIIGYYMKQVRDKGLYLQDGYNSIEEFAKGEYKLSESTAKRFMDINTMFSVGGNSLEIRQEYNGYGYSKLQEMLTMKEEDLQLVTPDTTVKQIREIKALEREENKIIDMEEQRNLPLLQMAADETDENEEISDATSRTPLEDIIIAFWQEEIRQELLQKFRAGLITASMLAEEISPTGSMVYSRKLEMLIFYSESVGIKYRYIKDKRPAMDSMMYDEFIAITMELDDKGCFDKENEIEEQAIVVKKEWEEPVLEEQETYKLLPGQTTVNDVPGLMPQQYVSESNESVSKTVESVTETAENVSKMQEIESIAPAEVITLSKNERKEVAIYDEITKILNEVNGQIRNQMYWTAKDTVKKLEQKLDEIIELNT